MSTFARKEALKAEKNCTLWKPIFNYAVDKLDRRDNDGGVRRYSSTKHFLTYYLEKKENMEYSRVLVVMDF